MAGLFHSDEQLSLARDNREREPVASALRWLSKPAAEPLQTAYRAAMRYQFFADGAAAAIALEQLGKAEMAAAAVINLARCKTLLGWLTVAAMLRQHARWHTLQSQLLPAILAALAGLPAADDPLAEIWQGALRLGAGIVFEHEPSTRLGAAAYRMAVDDVIHPEGFLKGIVDVDVESGESTYAKQVSGTCALTLMAEMGSQAGLNLWSYENRGVSPVTAATYLLYYYYYPERWRWSEKLTVADTAAVIASEGAFIEVVNRRQPLRGIEYLLAEMRPLFSAAGGGLTSLTHGLAPPKKRRWRLL